MYCCAVYLHYRWGYQCSLLLISCFASNKMAQGETISFKQALAAFPSDCRAATSIGDISPHLCFICLLHLANEHGLSIHGSADLEDLSIQLPLAQ